MSTVPTPIVDKNGKQTTVHKKVEKSVGKNRAGSVGAPPKSAAKKPGLLQGKPNTETGLGMPQNYIDDFYEGDFDAIQPSNRTEAMSALRDPLGKKSGGRVRWIELDSTSTKDKRGGSDLSEYSLPVSERSDTFNIVPPRDGTPVIVRVRSGLPRLNIESGNAVIMLGSNWGNSLRVAGDANVTVIAGYGCKVRIEAEEDAVVTVVPQTDARGSVSPSGNASVEIVDWDSAQHRVEDMSIPKDYEKPARDRAAGEEAASAWVEEKRAKMAANKSV